jgi:acyl transferase domain-containing protein
VSQNLGAQEIAVIGIGCRFPDATSPSEFWQLLRSGSEAITVFPAEELAKAGVPSDLRDDPHYVPAAGVVADSDQFDARLFGINPKEATLMDPQHRIMLECAWEALEDGGYDPRKIDARVGVFAGSYKNDYAKLLGPFGAGSSEQFLAGVSTDADYLATRISFKLNFTGPSVSVQTACSTGLVAVHLAAESLRAGSCDIAIAGGITIRSGQHPGYLYHEGGIYSPDGHCRAFDAAAQGTVIGEGAGMVMLKRLSDALADGDPIRAVIVGSVAGNDGADRVGFSAPGVAGQARIIQVALERSGVSPDTIAYVETHGSGTPLGDRIEIDALTRAFRAAGWSGGTCAIGSVKTNIGHTHAAAGIAGLIKTILVLENGEIPPSLHFREPNPRIDFAGSPFRVSAELAPWPVSDGPRRAGVSSFGLGGTGVHMVLEEAPRTATAAGSAAASTSDGSAYILPLSANDRTALDRATERLADHLGGHPGSGLADVARTLQTGRHHFGHRRIVVARDRDDAVEVLRGRDPQRVLTLSAGGTDRRVAFLLPGLGEQYENMGRDLYGADPVFRREMDRCLEILHDTAGLDLRPVLYPSGPVRANGARAGVAAKPDLRAMLGRTVPSRSTLDETRYAQPAMFAVEYALAQVWLARGVRPDALIGYSLGECVAATLAGVFSLEDGLRLAAERARLIAELPGGAMLAVQLPEAALLERLDGDLSLAAVNADDLCVVAGPEPAIAAFAARLGRDGVTCRRLRTTHAFHSSMMEPLVAGYTDVVRTVPRNTPRIPYVSTVTGDWITDAEATDPAYYGRHLRQAVRFGDGIRRLWQQPGRLMLEIGMGRPLGSMAQQVRPRTADAGSLVLGSLPAQYDGENDRTTIATTTAKLWLTGVDVDWSAVQSGGRRVALPTYPFQRRRYWPDSGRTAEAGAAAGSDPRTGTTDAVVGTAPGGAGDGTDDRGRRALADWFYTPQWETLPAAASDRSDGSGPWLLFADDLGLAESLTRRLRERGDSVTVVRRGAGFAAHSDGGYVVDPGNGEDYVRLLRAVRSAGAAATRIVHLWLVTPRTADPTRPAAIEDATRRGFTSLLLLAQAVGRESGSESVEVSVVSTDMHDVVDGDRAQPAKTLALGPCRVWPLENPAVTCRSVDIALPTAGGRRTAAERLVAELDRPVRERTGTEVVAIRGRLRLRQTFQPAPGPAWLRGRSEATAWRTGGTYLITGGLGGIGLALAEHLAESVRANLVLIARSDLPPRDRWAALAGRPDGDATADRIRAVQRMEAAGSTVLVRSADVTDAERLNEVVREAVQRFGTIHGVVHAAGVPGGGLIQLKDVRSAAAVLAPKVQGALALRRACSSLPLDFVVHCSSGIAVSGGVGQVDYCAANAFLDALAHADNKAGGPPVIAVNWDAWQGVGMAAREIGGAAGRSTRDTAVRHPFLERRLAGVDGRHAVYVSHFDATGSWLVDEHRMLGRPVVPGVGHLELVRAAFAHEQGQADRPDFGVELTDVTFFTPIVVPETGAKKVHVVLERDADGASFAVVSAHRDPASARSELASPAARAKDSTAGDTERWQTHSTGRVAAIGAERPRRLDVGSITDRMDDIGRPGHDGPMGFGARSQCLQRMYVGDGEFLGRLALPEQFHAEVGHLALHPALMDIATAFVGVYHAKEFRIPISYQRLRMFAPLAAEMYSHQVYRDGDQVGKETVTSDVTITDLAGNELVRAEGFVLKRVHDLNERLTAAHAAATGRTRPYEHPPVREADPAPGSGSASTSGEPAAGFLQTALDHGMSTDEGIEVLRRILAAGLAPQVLVSTRRLAVVLEEVARARTASTDLGGQVSENPVRTALSHPRPDLLTPYEAPRDSVEQSLAELWQELLGVDKVGVHDHFFELGGHSLLGLQMVPRLRAVFAVDLPLGAIFDAPTVANLAGAVRAALGDSVAA